MSNPSSSNTSPLALHHHHHHHQQRTVAATPPPPPPPPPASPSSLIREYRKGNWTLQETLILIQAKRLDDERRYPGGSSGGANSEGSGGSAGGRPAEQRWKWIENYCWKNGCHRSQNQCNDKWDNLLREYKKVRDYESRSVATTSAAGAGTECPSYWTMERSERKERNLPTNLAREVFDALTDVLGKRAARRALPLALLPPPQTTLPGTIVTTATTVPVSPSVLSSPSPSPSTQPMLMKPSPVFSLPAVTPQPPPPPIASVSQSQSQPSFSDVAIDVSPSSESTDNEDDDEPAPKRRRLRRLGSSVVRSATVLARTLLACEEKRERRHRDLLNLEERRLRLEEQRAEQHHQGFVSLVSAVNNLSGAIHALVSDHRNSESTGFRSPQAPHRQVGDMSR